MRYDYTANHQHRALLDLAIIVRLGYLESFRTQTSWTCAPCRLARLHPDHPEQRAVLTSCLYIKLPVRYYVAMVTSFLSTAVHRRL